MKGTTIILISPQRSSCTSYDSYDLLKGYTSWGSLYKTCISLCHLQTKSFRTLMSHNPAFKCIRDKLAENCHSKLCRSHPHTYQTSPPGSTQKDLSDTTSSRSSFLPSLSSIKSTPWVHHSSPVKNCFASIPVLFISGWVRLSDLLDVNCIASVSWFRQHSAQRWVSWY